jgi:hypothetical protein
LVDGTPGRSIVPSALMLAKDLFVPIVAISTVCIGMPVGAKISSPVSLL